MLPNCWLAPNEPSLSSIPNFDPRQIPVVGVDTHLPTVQREWLLPQALQEQFANPPNWSPEVVLEKPYTDRTEATNASVLVPIVLRGSLHDQPTVLLTQRTACMPTHSGQIAFPGGKSDPSDADAAATALREAHEEIGLEAEFVQVLGQLPIYVTGSAFVITPVVALIHPGFTLVANPVEVADIFEVPLEFLMNPSNHRRHEVPWRDTTRQWFSMPYNDLDTGKEHFIWGATAGMLRNFYRFLVAR
jgi:8-oxo-dGTP pyrophosphatase MutT (NUDIX family)